MELYRILWRRVRCAVAVLGVVNAVLVLPGKTLVGLAVCAAIVGPTVSPVPPPCHGLSSAELCWRWRTSTTALATTVSPGQRLYLIHTRDALLDELAHRDPDGFTRWLHSDTRTVNDPAPFLTTTADPLVRPRHDR